MLQPCVSAPPTCASSSTSCPRNRNSFLVFDSGFLSSGSTLRHRLCPSPFRSANVCTLILQDNSNVIDKDSHGAIPPRDWATFLGSARLPVTLVVCASVSLL